MGTGPGRYLMFEISSARIGELRSAMLEELLQDIEIAERYRSRRLNADGLARIDELAIEACTERDESWLARELERYIVPSERTRKGPRRVNARSAAVLIADGIWNNLVCRAECLASLADGTNSVTVYRAGHRKEPRAGSVHLVGREFESTLLLDALRADAIDPAGNRSPVTVGPNSGLSVRSRGARLPAIQRGGIAS